MTPHDHDTHPHDHDTHPHDGDTHPHDGDTHPHDGDSHPHEHRSGLRGLTASLLRPHSHDPADSVDSALEASEEGMRALKISLAGLALTAIIQVTVVVMTSSVALLADTVHNFADALTAVPLGLAFWIGRRPANRRYTYGYGRAEDLAGVFIVLTVAASSVFAGWEAIERLLHPETVRHIGWVIGAGLVGFAGNELVAHYRITVGRRIGSAALEADGYHARTDGITSLGVVVSAIAVGLGWSSADPILGLAITVAILLVVKKAARDVYARLMDAVDPSLVDRIEEILSDMPGVEGVESIRIRWIGHELHAEAEIISDADLSLTESHDIAEASRHRLLHQIGRLSAVTIHSSPCGHNGVDPHALAAHHFERPPTAR